MTLERMITTDISANIVAALLKRRWTVKRISQTIDAPVEFVRGIQSKKNVLTLADIQAIAEVTGETAPQIILHSIKHVRPEVKALFDVTKQSLDASAKLHASLRRPARKRRRTPSKAA